MVQVDIDKLDKYIIDKWFDEQHFTGGRAKFREKFSLFIKEWAIRTR